MGKQRSGKSKKQANGNGIERREFIKLGASGVAVTLAGCATSATMETKGGNKASDTSASVTLENPTNPEIPEVGKLEAAYLNPKQINVSKAQANIKSGQIDIFIEKSGSKLVKIVDNGCGIAAEQMEIAFSRHATSKITGFDDLDMISSYGFRGEALPSIASVSRLTMISRPHDAELGTEIIFEGGVLQSNKPIAAPPGTSISVTFPTLRSDPPGHSLVPWGGREW